LADIGTGLLQAFKLIISLDRDLLAIVFLSLRVSGIAVATAALIGIPLGAFLGMRPSVSVRWLEKLINTLMGLPPVVAGLVIYLLLSNKGPIGQMQLLFTPMAMIIAQTVLATPIITGLSLVAVRDKHKEIRDTAVTLGASQQMIIWTVIREAKRAIMAAVVAGFGRVVAEVGAVMMVGGNIQGSTRVMTTAIVLETRKGNFELALGLGIILLVLAFIINSLLYRVQGEV
jgi:tungstate transport system permease protein